jgi:hypothetical protein
VFYQQMPPVEHIGTQKVLNLTGHIHNGQQNHKK